MMYTDWRIYQNGGVLYWNFLKRYLNLPSHILSNSTLNSTYTEESTNEIWVDLSRELVVILGTIQDSLKSLY